MSVRYSQYLNAAAVRHRSISYNSLAPIVDGKGQKPSRIKMNFSQVVDILGPYCGLRVFDQLKAVAPLAAYLMLFQLLVLRHPVDSALTLCFGLIAVVIGLAVFMEGLSTGLMPFGNIIGDNLPKKSINGCGASHHWNFRGWCYFRRACYWSSSSFWIIRGRNESSILV
jgi:hypothetical protein